MLLQIFYITSLKLNLSYLLVICSALRFQCAGLLSHQDQFSAVVFPPIPTNHFSRFSPGVGNKSLFPSNQGPFFKKLSLN